MSVSYAATLPAISAGHSDWIDAVAKKETVFCPLDCFVSTDGKNWFGVIIAGQISTQNLNDLRAAFKAVPEDL